VTGCFGEKIAPSVAQQRFDGIACLNFLVGKNAQALVNMFIE
jgi:hypothetical protein